MLSSIRKIPSIKQFINPFGKSYRCLVKTTKCYIYRRNVYCFSTEPNKSSQRQSIKAEEREKIQPDQRVIKNENQGNEGQKQQQNQRKGQGDFLDQKPKFKPVLLFISAFLGFAAFYFFQKITGVQAELTKIQQKNRTKTSDINSSSKPKSKFGGVWSLTDTESQPFGSKELQGTNYLIYFGFTKCPDICPNTLNYLNIVIKLMKALPELKIKVVFVSVDPERDTPEVIKKYLSNYDESFVGVTGLSLDDDRLKQCMKNFKVYARKVLIPDNQSNYNVDHTSLVYIMNENNEFVDIVNTSLSERQSALDIARKIVGQPSKVE